MEISFSGKTVFITGAASGIGRQVAQAFAEAGANVAVSDISDSGKHVAEALPSANNARHIFVKTDVASKESVTAAVDAAVKEYGSIDVLINNAGIDLPGLLVDAKNPGSEYETSPEQFDSMVSVNQKGAFLVAQAAARQMVKQGSGVIINMSSECGLEGSEGQGCYAATKAALYSFTRSWAKELGRHGVRVVGMAPGILEPTGLRSEKYEKALAYIRGTTVDELRSAYEKASVPLKRTGTLKEVADLALFLASEQASYMTGTVINMSGGKSRA